MAVGKPEIYDVIVMGVGSMGSSACYYLAKQGYRVLGLEQFSIPNELSSHAGQSRIIRKAYFEHPDYVPLLERAYHNWAELENESREKIYYQTGLLYAGPLHHPMIEGVKQSASRYDIPLEYISQKEAKKKFGSFTVPEDYAILFEPDAGFVTPEQAITQYARLAVNLGAHVQDKVQVLSWTKTQDIIHVHTSNGNYTAKKLIITAGPWAGKWIPPSVVPLRITRQVLAWVDTAHPSGFQLGTIPCWLIADKGRPGVFYGFPVLPEESFEGPSGFKLALHYPGEDTDPDQIDRTVTPNDERLLVDFMERYFPGEYRTTLAMKTCMYTNSTDEHFILDFLPGYDQQVVIATGFSGHGFKFASVIGEILCDLAVKGNTKWPIGFLRAGRFR